MKDDGVQSRCGSVRRGLSRRDFLRATTCTSVSSALVNLPGPAATANAAPEGLRAATGVPTRVKHYDVIVVGATSAGIGAALAAGRQGMKVAVIEETPTLGGLLANGLSNTDLRSPAARAEFLKNSAFARKSTTRKNFPTIRR